MPYRTYLPTIGPPWLVGPVGKAAWEQMGRVMDQIRVRMTDASKARFPHYAGTDSLNQIGQDRQLPRGAAETDSVYATRLHDAWTAWGGDNVAVTGKGGGAGSHLGLLRALALLGLPSGPSGATIVQQNGRYARLDANGLLEMNTALMSCINRKNKQGNVIPAPGWTFEGRDTFHSEFGVIFPTNVASLTAGSVLATQMNDAIRKWKPAKLYIGCWILQTGETLGWPPTGTVLGGAAGNLGGDVIRYIAPEGGNRIGYTMSP